MATFAVYDKDGKEVAKQEKSFDHYKRHSMRGAAEQKFLDSLYKPGVVTGVILHKYRDGKEHTTHFDFVNGRTSMNWKKTFGE